MDQSKIEIVIASDVCKRDGIGIEVYKNDKLVEEIFRDDTELSRKVTIYEKEIELDFLEKCIESFRENIPWDYIDYDKM